MLKFFIFSTFYFFIIELVAQEKLRIEYDVNLYYETTEKSDINIIHIPTNFELLSDKNESLYTFIPKINNEQTLSIGSGISASMSADTNPVYKNMKDEIFIQQGQIAEKIYLIIDKLPNINWQITKETKEIAGFPVLRATAILDDRYKTEIEAWYSPKLNYKTGPEKFWGLPGIILEVKSQINHDDGSIEGTKYVANKVEILNSNEKFKIPNKGKEVTEKEFYELNDAYLEKIMEMHSGGVDKD